MIQDVAPSARRRDRNLKIRFDLLLADIFVEAARPQIDFITEIFVDLIAA